MSEVIEKANNDIRQLMLNNGLGESKYIELLKKAETSAKSTKDYISVANEIKEMNNLAPVKTTREIKESYNYKAELAQIDNKQIKESAIEAESVDIEQQAQQTT